MLFVRKWHSSGHHRCKPKRAPQKLQTILWCLACVGCGNEVDLHPASGKVVYPDGAPVPSGSLELTSIDAQPPRVARSAIQPDGSFRLETILEQGAAPGALAGKHRVLVRSPLRSEREPSHWKPTVHLRYGSYDSSGLVQTIEPADNQITIKVERP